MSPNGERGTPPVVPMVGELFPTRWRLTAMLLVVIAIGAQLLSMKCAGDAANLMARSIAESDITMADSAYWLARFSDRFHVAGLILGVAGMACWGVSLWDGEPGRRSVIVALLAAWFLLLFVMV